MKYAFGVCVFILGVLCVCEIAVCGISECIHGVCMSVMSICVHGICVTCVVTV